MFLSMLMLWPLWGVCVDSFIAWKNSPGACQSFIAADQILIESVGNPRCARMPAESVVGVYRVYVDLMLNSRRPDFVSRMISTIPLGVLAQPVPISLFSREFIVFVLI